MVGQGIGPIEDPQLAARAREVLPRVDLILIREKLTAPALLRSFGVLENRIVMTGDDAIEMTYQARLGKRENNIGLGMRVSNYAGVKDSHIEEIQHVLRETALKHEARFISIPISYSAFEWELDDLVIQRLSAGRNISRPGLHRYDEPAQLIKLASRCRLVVTGAFHPAVFALAQGIPAICLSSSDTYTNKFLGLIDLFGNGCKVLDLNDKDFPGKLASAIDSAWNSADQVRPQLLEAARRQIDWGHEGYQRIHDLVTSQNTQNAFGLNSVQR
jgi:colanic acid/amylovoran biosynthesis protein